MKLQKQEQKAQIMSADFSKLTKNTNNDELKSLYEYFDSEEPSYTNEYTGMFKDYNIIFITAESFSQYAIDKDLTPTLWKMYNEGFQFENYYSPAWGVSTTDGEYANLTGLIPKSGVWSFSKSAENNVSFPFTLGEQSRNLVTKQLTLTTITPMITTTGTSTLQISAMTTLQSEKVLTSVKMCGRIPTSR